MQWRPNRSVLPIELSDSQAEGNHFFSGGLVLGHPPPCPPPQGGRKRFWKRAVEEKARVYFRSFCPFIFLQIEKTFMLRITLPPPLWGRAGWGVSPAGRGYLRPSIGAAGPILEKPARIKPTSPLFPSDFWTTYWPILVDRICPLPPKQRIRQRTYLKFALISTLSSLSPWPTTRLGPDQ